MEFRSALPVAVLLGSVLGAAAVGVSSPKDGAAPLSTGLVSEAAAAAPSAKWDIPIIDNAPVQRFVTLFTGKQSDRMALYLKRSGRYEGMIRSKLREEGMPEDLLYLSMIESGFNPTARSKAEAVGLWQFIEETGERYGLRVDGYVDERRHPEKSTDAALKYLQDLHNQFGSWYLAAAAYNTGENRVKRVMREVTGATRGQESDFWRIRGRLPAETREYVPLMVAAAVIGKEPHKYGLGDVKRWLPIETETVMVPAGTQLEVVGSAVGLSDKEIGKLNPELIRSMTPPGNEAYPVRIPQGRSARYAADFDRMNAEAIELAKVERAREAEVAAAKRAEARRLAAVKRTEARRAASSARRVHTVRKGESLWTIARRNGTSVEAIRSANGLDRRAALRPGQKIRVPR